MALTEATEFTLLRQDALWLATGRNGVFGFAGFRKDAPRLAAGCFTKSKRWLYFFRGTKKIKPIFFSVISVRSSELGERVRNGFTLIEILVALVIVAITVSVALEAQITSLKIEQKARALRFFRFETQRIFSATHRVKNEAQLAEALSTGGMCQVKSELVKIESGTNVLSFIKHELSADLSAIVLGERRRVATAEDPSSFSSVFFTRVPNYPRQRPDDGGDSVDGQKSTLVP